MIPKPSPHQLRRDRPLCHRIMLITCMITLGFSGIIWRLYDLHLKKGPALAEVAARKYRREIVLPAQRGSIKDLRGKYLAHDEEVFELQTDRVHLYDVHSIVPCLAQVQGIREKDITTRMSDAQILAEYHEHVARALRVKLGQDMETMKKAVTSPLAVNVLAKNLDEDEAAAWREHLSDLYVKGVYIKPSVRRCYPVEDRLALVVGAVNGDHEGAWGLEKTMESRLRGTPGKVSVEQDKYGRELPLYRGRMIDPVHGRDVHLTIDMRLQDRVDEILEAACATHHPGKATAVVVDVSTGSILAMACRPNHCRSNLADTNWRNFVITEPYEPGSTFKIVTFAAALDLRKVGMDELIDCEHGTYTDPVLKVTIDDDEDLGRVSACKVLSHSSNIGTYKIFKRVGQQSFLKYVHDFGFGQTTGLPLTGERAGYVNTDDWSNPTYSRFPIGYEISTTPLQVAMAYAAVANGGVLMQPRIVDRITSSDGREEEIIPPQSIRQVCTARTAASLRQMLEAVVTEGTGKRAKLESIKLAGKTGTSRRYDPEKDNGPRRPKGGYVDGEYVTSFAGFAPADDPKIAVVVVLDNPKAASDRELRGGLIAAPIFSEIVEETLEMLTLWPQRPLALKGGAP